ncbi:hypothetical protein D3C87_2088560 [compost metagenome]
MFDKSTADRHAGIVDENADARIVPQSGLDLRQIRRLGQIGLDDIDLYAGFLPQTA